MNEPTPIHAVPSPSATLAVRSRPRFSEAVVADVWRLYGRFSWTLLAKAIFTQRFFRPIFSYRLFHGAAALPAPVRGPVRWVLRFLHRGITARRCMQMPLECEIGPGLFLNHAFGLVLNPDLTIGANVTLLHQVTLGSSRRGVPCVDDDVTVAAGAMVIGPVVLGHGCTVGAGAVVLKSVEPLAVVAGNPAAVVGRDSAPRTPKPAPRR